MSYTIGLVVFQCLLMPTIGPIALTFFSQYSWIWVSFCNSVLQILSSSVNSDGQRWKTVIFRPFNNIHQVFLKPLL